MLNVVSLGAYCEVSETNIADSDRIPIAKDPIPDAKPSPYVPDAPESNTINNPRQINLHFKLTQFADLSDNTRVTLRNDRGFTKGLPKLLAGQEIHDLSHLDPWQFITRKRLSQEVMGVLEPDNEQEWLEWVIERLSYLGIEVDPASVENAPYRVEFGKRVEEHLHR